MEHILTKICMRSNAVHAKEFIGANTFVSTDGLVRRCPLRTVEIDMATPPKDSIDKADEYQKQYWKDYRERHKRRERERGHPGQKRYADDNPIKVAARLAVLNAVRTGALIKPDRCETCSEVTESQLLHGHHDDYDYTTTVRWLCPQCHTDWHDENGPGLNGDQPDMGMLDRFEKFADKTFDDACALYLSEFEGKCLTRQMYALKHIQPYIGHLPLIDVDDQALIEYKRIRKTEAMVGTINKELSTATAVLNKAAKVWRWIPSAPKLQRVKGEHRKPYPLTWAEQINMFKRLTFNTQKIALFAVNTGCRREEIFKLRWDDERDIDGVMVFILRDTKNGQDRPVICNSIARRIVNYMREPSRFGAKRSKEFVFPRETVSKILNKAWLMADLPDDPLVKKGIHNLRHTFGYRLRSEGVAGEDRDALLGHHAKSLTQHYAVPDIKRLAALAERITVRRDTAVLR